MQHHTRDATCDEEKRHFLILLCIHMYVEVEQVDVNDTESFHFLCTMIHKCGLCVHFGRISLCHTAKLRMDSSLMTVLMSTHQPITRCY